MGSMALSTRIEGISMRTGAGPADPCGARGGGPTTLRAPAAVQASVSPFGTDAAVAGESAGGRRGRTAGPAVGTAGGATAGEEAGPVPGSVDTSGPGPAGLVEAVAAGGPGSL